VTGQPLEGRQHRAFRRAGAAAASHEILAAEIARRLNLSEGTVRNYLSESIAKLGAANRIEAARLARQRGWL
jgi:two-component system response regulator DesR